MKKLSQLKKIFAEWREPITSKVERIFIRFGHKILNSRYFSKFFGTYKTIWDLAGITKSTAMDAILCDVKDENKFWSYGEKDAEKLKIFVDKNSVVLDVGCGIGRVEKFLAKYCEDIHGVDVSGRMIRFARNELKECKNCFFHKTNGKDFSIFPDNKFDFVFSIITLQHLEKEDVYIYMEEMYRVLKPNGRVYLNFLNSLSDSVFEVFVNNAKSRSRHIARIRGYVEPEVDKMMKSVGFKDLKMMKELEGKYIIAVATKK